MRVRFLTSVAGMTWSYDHSLVYDLPAAEAEHCVKLGWAVSLEETAPIPIPITFDPPHQRGREKSIGKRGRELR